MWVEEIKDKETQKVIAYKFIERYLHKKSGKMRRVSVQLKTNSKQSENKASVLLKQKIDDINNTIENDGITFKEAYQSYYNATKNHWKRSSEASVSSLYKNHIEPYSINDYLVLKIETNDVREVVDRVHYDKKLSPTTTKKVRNLIKAVLSFCKDEYGLVHKVAFNRVLIPAKEKKTKIDFIDSSILADEINRMHQILSKRHALFCEAQILTGMRFSELAALTKNDWDGEYISINKSVETANKRKVGRNKTYDSKRVIQSSERVNEIFEGLIKENEVLFKDKASLIFANQKNRPMLNYYLNRKLKEVNEDYTTHTMRHTHISLLAEKELPLKYIMDRVGHVKPTTTLSIYTHVSEKTKQKGQNALDNLY